MRAITLFALLATLALLACGGASGGGRGADVNDPAALRASAASSDWATEFFGTPPESTTVMRLSALPEDTRASMLPDPMRVGSPGIWAIAHASQVDIYETHEMSVGVLHDVPTWLDPTRPYPKPHAPDFAFTGRTPSGALLFDRTGTSSAAETTRLVVLNPSTWIFATGIAADRLATAARIHEPPRPPALDGSIVDQSKPLDPTNTKLESLRWIKHFDHVTGGGIAMFAPRSDRSSDIVVKLVFTRDDDAQDAARDLTTLIASGGIREKEGGKDVFSATTTGSILLLHGRIPR